MAERQFLADIYTPSLLTGLCRGLTDFRAYEAAQPFIGKWIRLSGKIFAATPNPQLGTAGVTIEFQNRGPERQDAFLTFNRDLDRLAKADVGEEITAEGQIKSISSHSLVLENCGLPDPQIVSTMKVAAAARELQKAVEDRIASGDPIKLKPVLPEIGAEPEPDCTVDKPRLPDAALTLWHHAFLKAYPSGSKGLAEKSAAGAFPNHHVARTRIRELFPNAPRGRPKKNNDLNNSRKNDGE